jgi:hypothetical protein
VNVSSELGQGARLYGKRYFEASWHVNGRSGRTPGSVASVRICQSATEFVVLASSGLAREISIGWYESFLDEGSLFGAPWTGPRRPRKHRPARVRTKGQAWEPVTNPPGNAGLVHRSSRCIAGALLRPDRSDT